jgi:hypothetical protein
MKNACRDGEICGIETWVVVEGEAASHTADERLKP